ncbi:hypothetical protein GGX14DRAFT_580270 [Mycena pura]|uniref:CxC2-like cysteine cluster KDZ transposase-associated domain-containing protein n=1 Tax=Mycena pura TaxID=153505 RepID=A0AAD6UL46_9AGAR|nr:hypothetical protein GGX14DRAFT_580270 [Mycena pura]
MFPRGRSKRGRGGAPQNASPRPILASAEGTFTVNSSLAGQPTSRQYYVPRSPAKNATVPPENAQPLDVPGPYVQLQDVSDETPPKEDETKKRERVAHMERFESVHDEILDTLLENYHDADLLQPCSCEGGEPRVVRCLDCLQAPIVCPQCFLRQHRRAPTHWASIWNADEGFFEKMDISLVMEGSAVFLGHGGQFCECALPRQHFTLVDTNGVHATVIAFCGCNGMPLWKQLLQWREYHHQSHMTMWDFVHVLQLLTDPWVPSNVPDFSKYFDNISRTFQYLDTQLAHGQKHGIDTILPSRTERPYPHRPTGYLGTVCAACPEPGVNMPLGFSAPGYMRHTDSENITSDGNFKANLFIKQDNGSDKALTDGRMYFEQQERFEKFAAAYVVKDIDKVSSLWLIHNGDNSICQPPLFVNPPSTRG